MNVTRRFESIDYFRDYCNAFSGDQNWVWVAVEKNEEVSISLLLITYCIMKLILFNIRIELFVKTCLFNDYKNIYI